MPRSVRLVRSAILALVLLVPAGSPADAVAQDGPRPRHGVAMHGEPALPAGFAHLPYANPDAPKGGAIRHGATGSFDSLNPFIVRGRPALGLGMTYESLLARSWDEPFTLYGLLAETVTLPEDRSWVEFTLHPKARFHDGHPVTVEDVLFSWRMLRDEGSPRYRTYYSRVASAGRTGERSVRFTFASGAASDAAAGVDRELALIMGLMPILPAHWYDGREFDRTMLEPMPGSGPYRVGAVDPGRSITYRRVEDWWGRDLGINRGLYNFDEIRYDHYRDEGVSMEAFQTGAYDFRRETDPRRWAIGYDGPAVEDGRIAREVLPHSRPEPMRALIYNTRRPLFADRRVREALGHLLDFEWMNRTLFHGAYRRTDSFYPNSELAAEGLPSPAELALLEPWRAELPPELFDKPFTLPATDASGPAGMRPHLRRAVGLLAEAGWRLEDGRMLDDEGRPFTFEILLNDPGDERIALEFARQLRRIGIDARVRTVDSAQYRARLDEFDFDMTLNRWISTLSPGNEQRLYWSSEAAGQTGSRNYAGIRNPAVDALVSSLGDARTREDLVTRVHALDRALLWGHYVIPLFHQGEDRVAYWRRLERPEVTPVYGLVIESWWSGE